MARDIDHLLTTYRIAAKRRAAGKPIWDCRINLGDVWHSEVDFIEKRDKIVNRIRKSGWLDGRDETDHLVEIVENLAYAEDSDEFDGWWDDLYDIADIERVWISTF